jgi:translation elongation factor EF-1beta
MTKKAIITISLVPQASEVSNSQLKEDIKKTLQCDWLAEIEGVKVKNETQKITQKVKRAWLQR